MSGSVIRRGGGGHTDLATDVQTHRELASMGQTDHSQEVPEVRAGICEAAAHLMSFESAGNPIL